MTAARPSVALAAALLWGSALADTQAAPQWAEFAWRATLDAPAEAPLLRVQLPPAALGALQSRSSDDVRIFDAQGQALPHAVLPTPLATPQETAGARVQALPLQPQASTGSAQLSARVELRGSTAEGVQQLQLHWNSTDTPAAGGLQAAVFDLRAIQGMVSALDVDITLPDNAPVHLQASLGKTLQQWQGVPTTGPLYRFSGANAPRNTRLQFTQARAVQDHFLLLQWPANAQVQVQGLQVRTVAAAPAAPPVEVGLPPGERAPSGKGLEWTLPPGAAVQSVQWQLAQPQQLRTYQLQGRRATAKGSSTSVWESLGSVVVYHLQQAGEVRHNGPYPLPAGAWRTLRLTDWPNGETPAAEGLQARLQMQGVTLAFVANGRIPYTLAVGRADTPSTALPAATLAAAAATPSDSWPLVAIGTTVGTPHLQAQRFTDRWRYFFEDSQARSGFLWLVLALAVLVLGAVAVKLLRSTPPAGAPPRE